MRQPLPGPVPARPLPIYHKGGKVKKTGPAMVKKGERVLTAKQQKGLSAEAAARIRKQADKEW